MKIIKSKVYRALRGSEKYAKTDMVYLAKGGFWLFFTQIFATAFTFLLSIAYANFLSSDDYGTYKFVLALASIIGAFSLTGLSSAIVQKTATTNKNSLRDFFKINLRWSALSIIFFLSASAYYFVNENKTLGLSMLIIAICNPILSSSSLYKNFLNGKKDFRLLNKLSNLETLVTSICVFASLFLIGSALSLITTYFISHTVMGFILFSYTNKKFKESEEKFDDDELIGMSKHWSLLRILSIVATKIDEILIFHYLGAMQLAIYAFALAIPLQISGVFKNIYTLALPKFATAERSSGLTSKSIMIILVSLPLMILYIVCAPFIFDLFFPQYMSSVLFSQVLAVLILFGGTNINIAFIDAKREIKTKYEINIISDVSKIIIIICLVIPFGLWGAVIGRVLGKIVSFLFALHYSRKLERRLS